MSSPAKVLVIGIDSADRNLLLNLCESGELPVLQSLREKSAWGVLKSPPAMGDDATWASFYTSVSPAKHGRYFYKYIQPGSYSTPWFRDLNLKREPFWNFLSRTGYRVAIIDVPKCPLSKDLNGFQLADWLVHGRDHDTCSSPPEIASDILSRFGDDLTDRPNVKEWLCRMDSLSEAEYEIFLQRLLNSVDKKVQVSTEFLDCGVWDLFLVVFKESHCITHQCWHFLDDTHPNYNSDLVQHVGSPIKRVFKALDAAIGQLLSLVGPETYVIVFSDLGMGPNYTGGHILDTILLRLESRNSPIWRKIHFLSNHIEHKLRVRLFGHASPSYRRAFQLEHNEMSGAIRVNLKGREPFGLIRPGKELEEFYECLTQDLLDLVHPDSGNPIVERIVRTDDFFAGEQRDCLPDLFVVWRRDNPIIGAASPKIGELRADDPLYRTGNHVADGIYFCFGPSVPAGEQAHSASIMDIGPTIAAMLGTQLPDADGKPIAALSHLSDFRVEQPLK
jgi:predicted AlkP superfamily phosphohydrolase/phosphomutase